MSDNAPHFVALADVWGVDKFDSEPLEFDMVCPLLRLADPYNETYNWSKVLCENRIKHKSSCTKKCKIAKEIINSSM